MASKTASKQAKRKRGAQPGNKQSIKRIFLPKQDPSPDPELTRQIIVISTVIIGRQAFVSRLSHTQQGMRFIPHWTTNPADAMDFLTISRGRDHLALMHPAAGQAGMYCHQHIIPARPDMRDDDGPNYDK